MGEIGQVMTFVLIERTELSFWSLLQEKKILTKIKYRTKTDSGG